jgi:hypothetical protein
MITDEQLASFLSAAGPSDAHTDATIPEASPLAGLSYMPDIETRDKFISNVWTTHRVDAARVSLNHSVGANNLIPPTEKQQQVGLDLWWQKEGQFIPRNVLDQLGIVGGVTDLNKLAESRKMESRQRVGVVKDFLGIERPHGKDPLEDHLVFDVATDPIVTVPGAEIAKLDPKQADIIKSASIEDLQIISQTIAENPLGFDEDLGRLIEDEIKIKETLPDVVDILTDNPLTILTGTQFFNAIGFNLPEFTSRKGFSPTEALFGLPKGSESIWIRSVARVREQVVEQDPTLLAQIGGESGQIVADLIKFAVLPDPSKLKVFKSLSPAIKSAIGIGTKAGLVELLQAPEVGETVDERAKEVAVATGIGAITGAVFQKLSSSFKKLFTKIKELPIEKQAEALLKANPGVKISKENLTKALVQMKKVDPKGFAKATRFDPRKPITVEATVTKPVVKPKGFRPGFADIEKPSKIAKDIAKKVPRAKEAIAIKAAEKLLTAKKASAKVLPTKLVSPEEAGPMKVTFKETEGVPGTRIISDPKIRKQLQVKENQIAELRTKKKELKAEKQFEKTKVKAQEIAKKEIAIAKEISKKEIAIEALKEKFSIKLEQTIEGSRVKIAKIRESVEFKDFLRDDAISMIQAIPKEIRPSFINRANRIKTIKGVRKLMDEVEVGIEKIERKIETRGLSGDIKKIESDNRRGKLRLGKIPSPQREQLIETIDSIDLVKLSEKKEADLLSLSNLTKKLSTQLAGNLEGLDEDVEAALKLPSERVRQLLRLSQKPVADQTIEDIKLVRQSLQQLVHNAKLKSQLIIKGGLESLDGALDTVTKNEIAPTSSVRKGKTAKVEKGTIEKTADFSKKVLKLDDAHLDTLVQLSTNPDSPVTKKILDTDLHAGLRNTAEKANEWIALSRERFKEIGFKDVDQINDEIEVVLGGKKVKLTKDHLIKLELHSRSPENLKAILTTKGWAIGGVEINYTKEIDRLAELNKALSHVRKDKILSGIADWTSELTPLRGEAIDEASLLLNGYPIARDPSYTSRPRSLARKIEGSKDISVPPEQEGRYLPRTGGTQRMKLERWSDDFLGGLESDATLFGMAVPLRNARILVSSDAFQTAMKNAGRELELQNIITILRRTQGVTTSKSTLEVFGGKLQRGVVGSALGFRVSTVGAQAMSYPAAFAEIETFQRPMGPVGKATINRIEEDSGLMAMRWKGRRVGVEIGTSASFEAFETLFFGKSKSIVNKGLAGLIVGDKFAVGNIYDKGVVPELLSAKRNGKNVDPFTWEGENVADLPSMNNEDTKPFRYAAARRLEYVVRRTQPVFDMLDRSVSLSNPNVLERQLFIFRTALEAQENIAIRKLDSYGKSQKKPADKMELVKGIAPVIESAVAVAVWKNGLKWAIRSGATAILAAFGIFKFDDKAERENLAVKIAKDSGKNLLKLNKIGKFAVSIGERIADSVSGDGYNWNRNTFDLPIIDVLQTGVDTSVALTQAIVDAGLVDEFVEEITKPDKEFNKQLEDKLFGDLEKAIRSSYDFGVRISGAPLLAPIQEFLRPALADSNIKIIREVTFGDVDSPQEFSERVFELFELRTELNRKSKKKRLTRDEDQALSVLDRFVSKMNSSADILKTTESQQSRRLRFTLLESNISTVESRIGSLEGIR